jgi:hypothetical protein
VAIEADAPEVSPAEPVGSTAAKPDSGFLRDTIDI